MAHLGTILGGGSPTLRRYEIDESNLGQATITRENVAPPSGTSGPARGYVAGAPGQPNPTDAAGNPIYPTELRPNVSGARATATFTYERPPQPPGITDTPPPPMVGPGAGGNGNGDVTDNGEGNGGGGEGYGPDQYMTQDVGEPTGMKITTKILIGLGIAVAVGGLGYLVYRKFAKKPVDGLDDFSDEEWEE